MDQLQLLNVSWLDLLTAALSGTVGDLEEQMDWEQPLTKSFSTRGSHLYLHVSCGLPLPLKDALNRSAGEEPLLSFSVLGP